MEKVTSDFILETLKVMVESRKPISRDEWLTSSFKLNLLLIDENKLLNTMRQAVAQKKLGIYQAQTKRNVAAADLETEASDEFKVMKDQESKCYAIEEFIRISKKSSEF